MPYANIFRDPRQLHPSRRIAPALTDQLADIRSLQADAERRGWTSEAERHRRTAHVVRGHLRPGPTAVN